MAKKAQAAAQRVGRPTQYTREERETLILDSFSALIAEKGLHGATMAAVAHAAGMSKRTLYAVFDSREALFASWVRRVRASTLRPLSSGSRGRPVAERLRLLLRREVQRDSAEARLTALRAVIAESQRYPELARAFHREGPSAARSILHDELARAATRGELNIDDADAAAAMLLDMAYGQAVERLIDPDGAAPTEAEIAARLDLALRVFLDGVARR